MPTKAITQYADSQNPDTPVPFALSPLAIEDLTDEPVFRLTPAALAELATPTPQPQRRIPLTPLLEKYLTRFTAAKQASIDAYRSMNKAPLWSTWNEVQDLSAAMEEAAVELAEHLLLEAQSC